MTRSDANLALLRQLFDRFANGEFEALLPLLGADVEAHPRAVGSSVVRGRDAVTAWWRELTHGTELEARPLAFEAHGDVVLVRGYLRQQEGRAFSESQVWWLYELRDGRIVRMESHRSRTAALAAG